MVSRAGLLEERLRELGLPYRGGKHERGSATFRHSIQRRERLIQEEIKKERIWQKCNFHVPDEENKQ